MGTSELEPTLVHEIYNAKSQCKAKARSEDNIHGDLGIRLENCNPITFKEKTEETRKYNKDREADDEDSNGIDGLARLRQDTKQDHGTNEHKRHAKNEGEESIDTDFKQRRIDNERDKGARQGPEDAGQHRQHSRILDATHEQVEMCVATRLMR